MSVSGPGRVIDNGLVLYLDASNNKSFVSGNTTWFDVSRNNNSGSLINGPTYSSANGGSISFDGSNDYVSTTPPLNAGQQKYTLSAWWITSVTNRIQVIFEQNSPTLIQHRRSALLILNNAWGFNGESNDAHDKVPVRVNQWTNGVVTVDTTAGSNPIKIYENGFLYWQGNTSNNASNLNVSNSLAGLGWKTINNTEFFIGSIGQTSIYNRLLSADEILSNYNLEKKRFGL